MRRPVAAFAALLTPLLVFVGCGTNMKTQLNQGQIPVSMTITDTPPAGVTVLTFEIHISGASLQSTTAGQADVSLVTHDEEIELRHLETENALLSTAGAPAGTYNSLTLTFANPEMTIQNNSGAAITVGQTACAVNAICKLEPKLNQSSVVVSGAPFPLMLTTGTALALAVDFDVDTSLQTDLSVTPAVTVAPTIARVAGDIDEADDIVGQVTAVGTNQFTLQPLIGPALTIQVDNDTEFEDFNDGGCAANNFSCVQVNQIVSVDLRVHDEDENEEEGGDDSGPSMSMSLIAKKVELKDHFAKELSGEVVSVNAAGNQFQLAVNDEAEEIQGINLGDVLTVTVNSGATFDVDQDGLSIPQGLSFQSIGDMIAGQSVELDPLSISAGSSGVSLATDHVRLHRTQVTGSIASISGANFNLGDLSTLFTGAGIAAIQVQTSSQTNFSDGLSGVGSLSVSQTVSVGGLLFNSSPTPVLLAEHVRVRH